MRMIIITLIAAASPPDSRFAWTDSEVKVFVYATLIWKQHIVIVLHALHGFFLIVCLPSSKLIAGITPFKEDACNLTRFPMANFFFSIKIPEIFYKRNLVQITNSRIGVHKPVLLIHVMNPKKKIWLEGNFLWPQFGINGITKLMSLAGSPWLNVARPE